MTSESINQATPEEKDRLARCVFLWRTTEKIAIGASDEEKPAANRALFRATRTMRKAVDLVMRRNP